jgi:hypothetical protein
MGNALPRKFYTVLGVTLQMDLSYFIIHMYDNTYAYLPNLAMAKNHVEEIDIDPETEDIPEVFQGSLPYF